jgi:tetratricopeptide (TPR) repeat protein
MTKESRMTNLEKQNPARDSRIPDAGVHSSFVVRHSSCLVCLLLVLITVGLYWPVLRHGFINLDDPDYVTGNPRVQAGLAFESIRWAFFSFHSSNWHPLTWLSHMLDCQLYGLKPAGHHLTNVLFHVANVLLLFLWLRDMTGALWRSAVVAALFAVHPLHVESVAWVAERKDVLSTFFGLLSLWAYTRYAKSSVQCSVFSVQSSAPGVQNPESRHTGRHSLFTIHHSRWYFLSLLLFTLGLLSKPMLVTLPFLLLLLDYWPLRRFSFPTLHHSTTPPLRLLLEKLPFFALSAASCAVTFLVQKQSGAVVSLANNPIESRLAGATAAYGNYLAKTFWPSKLAVLYPWSQWDWTAWQVLVAFACLLAISGKVVFLAKQKPALLVGWLWFLGTLVPVIGLVQVGKQAWADRYTYVPHIGLFLMLVWGLAEVVARLRWGRLIAFAGASIVLAGFGFVASRQLSYWHDTKTLFQHTLAVTSGNYVAHSVLANCLIEENKLPEAIEQCRIALQLWPAYQEAHNTLGGIYARQGKYDEAIASYRKAIESDPTYGDAYYGIAEVLLKQKKYAEAEAQSREALRLVPLSLPAMFSLASAMHNQGKLEEAAGYYRQILAMNPKLFAPQRFLANVLLAQGKTDEAIVHLQAALKFRPGDAEAHAALGLAFLNKERVDQAAAQFQEAARLQPTNAVAHYQLALLYQGRKETRQAIESYRRALQVQPDLVEALNNLAWILATHPDAALRNGPEAVRLAERACRLTRDQQAFFVGTLAAAYAEAGRFTEAIAAAEKAIRLAQAAGQKEVQQKNQQLLELYRAGRAYHESE